MSTTAFRTLRNALTAFVVAMAAMLPQASADAPNPNGRTYAVLVGIADYPSSPLPRTDVDARRIGDALAAQLPAERLRTHLLLNGDATRGAVEAALREVARDATEQDEVVFFFSGHGDTRADEAGGDEGDRLDETIVLYDGQMTDDELAGLLRPIKSRMAIVAIDSCFSGGFLFDVGDENNRMTLLSSDEDLTSAVPSQEAGGWLSLYLAEALEGRADGAADGVAGQMQDGQLTALEIEMYIEERFSAQQRITASDPQSREVGYQRIDIKRTGVAPDDVFLNHSGEATGGVARNVLSEQSGMNLPGDAALQNLPRVELNAQPGLTYVIETFDLGPNTDTMLELRQRLGAAPADSDPVVAQNDDADGLASRIQWTASSAGAYYAVVRPYAAQTGGTFGLRVVEVTPSPNAPRPQVMTERNGITLPATDAFAALPTEAMILEAGRAYVVETFALVGQTDTVLQVRQMAGAAPAESDSVVAENDDADGLASRVRFTARQSGRYYAVVRPYAPQTAGTFGLRVIQMVPPTGAVPSAPVAQPVAQPSVQPTPQAGALVEQRGITLPSSQDFATLPAIQLPLEAGRTYQIETFDLAGPTDTVLELRRAVNGTPSSTDPVLAQNDDTVGLASRVDFTPREAGTYYALVAPYSPQTGGTFGLRVVVR
ncbi:MAG: caspase domain-containing protein [Sandaracinaceae bacterium]